MAAATMNMGTSSPFASVGKGMDFHLTPDRECRWRSGWTQKKLRPNLLRLLGMNQNRSGSNYREGLDGFRMQSQTSVRNADPSNELCVRLCIPKGSPTATTLCASRDVSQFEAGERSNLVAERSQIRVEPRISRANRHDTVLLFGGGQIDRHLVHAAQIQFAAPEMWQLLDVKELIRARRPQIRQAGFGHAIEEDLQFVWR